MSGVSQAVFIAKNISASDVFQKKVLDVGSRDYNGSIRPLLEHWKPANYVGIDVVDGPGVDLVLSANDLISHFDSNCFDIVVSIEMLEHALDWQDAIRNMKSVLMPGGIILLTTRSPGFPCHGFPYDFWRFTGDNLTQAFSDFEIITLENDSVSPGIFIAARKPLKWKDTDRVEISVQSVVTGRLESKIPTNYRQSNYYRKLSLKLKTKDVASRIFISIGRIISKVLGLK